MGRDHHMFFKNFDLYIGILLLIISGQCNADNFLINGDFETGTMSPWSSLCETSVTCSDPTTANIILSSEDAYYGYAFKAELNNDPLGVSGYKNNYFQTIDNIEPYTSYDLAFSAKSINTNYLAGVSIWFYEYDTALDKYVFLSGKNQDFDVVDLNTNTWNRYKVNITTPANAVRIRVFPRYYSYGATSYNGIIYWDNFTLTQPYNLITNGGFESGSYSNWSGGWCDTTVCDVTTEDTYNGIYALKIDSSLGTVSTDGVKAWKNSIFQNADNVQENAKYVVRFAEKTVATNGGSGITIHYYDVNQTYMHQETYQPVASGDNGWTTYSIDITTPSYVSRFRVWPSYSNSTTHNGTVFWDDIQVIPAPQIDALVSTTGVTEIQGNFFGIDPGKGSRSSDQQQIIINGNIVDDSLILAWSENQIQLNFLLSPYDIVKVRRDNLDSNVKVLDSAPYILSFQNSLEFQFNIEKGFAISKILSSASSRDFIVSDIQALSSLYEITVKDTPFTEEKREIRASEMSRFTLDENIVGSEKVLTITTLHDNENISVVSTIRLSEEGAKFNIDVQNNGSMVVQSVRYPIVAAKPILGTDPADDIIVMPYFEGYQLKNPSISAETTYHKDLEYPGKMTLQMMALYDSEDPSSGLYFSMDDNAGYKKRFGFERLYKEGLYEYHEFSFLHSTSESLGNHLSIPYNVIISTFQGDWYDAADKYKQWALSQPWTATKLQDRIDVPQWLYDIDAMIDCYQCKPDEATVDGVVYSSFNDLVSKYKNLLGTSNLLLYPGGFWGINNGFYQNLGATIPVSWSGVDYFTDDPVYNETQELITPPYPALKSSIESIQAQNSEVLLFIEGLTWDQYSFKLSSGYGYGTCPQLGQDDVISDEIKYFDDRQDYYTYAFNASANPLAVINENDEIYYKNFWATKSEYKDQICTNTTVMCVGGSDYDSAMEQVLYNNIKRGIDHGAKLMSLDALVSGKINGCWSEHHNHPVGEGKWTHDRFVSILNKFNQIISDKGQVGTFGVAMEDPHELYLPHLQVQYVRHGDLAKRGGNKKIPLFNYIYKE